MHNTSRNRVSRRRNLSSSKPTTRPVHGLFHSIRRWLCAGLLLLTPSCFAQDIAVLIIDDMGNGLELGQRALRLPGKINYAFLPHSPNGPLLADQAFRQGQEVLLHLPMSNLNGLAPGPGSLSPMMDRPAFSDALKQNLQSIPHVRGVNNHMGSLLTQLYQPMQWLMEDLKQRGLYFIDSRTTPLTVAEKTARSKLIPTMHRDTFLDNQLDPEEIDQQIEHWLQLAKTQGVAVAIGHPHIQTLSALEKWLPTLSARGIRLALASEVLSTPIAHNSAPSSTVPTHAVAAKN